jgi:hypothetical protein
VNIDWTQAFVAGIAGGLIAGVFVLAKLLYQGLTPRFGRFGAALLSVVGIAIAGAAIAYSPLGTRGTRYIDQQRGRARIARATSEQMMPVLKSPAFQQRIEGLNQNEINALAFNLADEGLLRLSDEQLVARAQLLSDAISLADEDTCAAQLLGPTPEQVQQLLANLSDQSLVAWSKLSAEAIAASLQGVPLRSPNQAGVEAAFRNILASLAEAEANRLALALRNPAALDTVDACWTAKTIYRSVASLPSAEQALLARVLAVGRPTSR